MVAVVFLNPAQPFSEGVGAWAHANSAGLHGTTAGPVQNHPALRSTQDNHGNIYLHIISWPKRGMLEIDRADLPQDFDLELPGFADIRRPMNRS